MIHWADTIKNDLQLAPLIRKTACLGLEHVRECALPEESSHTAPSDQPGRPGQPSGNHSTHAGLAPSRRPDTTGMLAHCRRAI